MAKEWFVVVGNAGVVSAGGLYISLVTGTGNVTAVEAKANTRVRGAYTWDRLYVRIIANVGAGGQVTSRKNGALGAQVVNIGAAATGEFEDNANSDNLVDGDRVCTNILTAGANYSVIAYRLQAATAIPILESAKMDEPNLAPAGSTWMHPIDGCLDRDTAANEIRQQRRFRTASVLSNLRMYLTTNGGTTHIRTRINGVNGNLVATAAAAATGEFEDIVNSDNIAIGNLVNLQSDNDGGANVITIHVKSSCAVRQPTCHLAAGFVVSFNQTRYFTMEGILTGSAVEGNSQMKARADCGLNNLYVYVDVSTLNVDAVVRIRKNGADGNLHVHIAAFATGIFEDLVNSDNCVAADEINYQFVAPNGAGSITVFNIGVEQGSPSGGAMPWNIGRTVMAAAH